MCAAESSDDTSPRNKVQLLVIPLHDCNTQNHEHHAYQGHYGTVGVRTTVTLYPYVRACVAYQMKEV